MENSCKCEFCKVDVHRTSYVKHVPSKKHSENIGQDEIITPEWLFKEEQTPITNKIKKIYNPKTLKQSA